MMRLRDAPEMDGMVCVSGAGDAELGTFVRARITDCEEYDLFGEAVSKRERDV